MRLGVACAQFVRHQPTRIAIGRGALRHTNPVHLPQNGCSRRVWQRLTGRLDDQPNGIERGQGIRFALLNRGPGEKYRAISINQFSYHAVSKVCPNQLPSTLKLSLLDVQCIKSLIAMHETGGGYTQQA